MIVFPPFTTSQMVTLSSVPRGSEALVVEELLAQNSSDILYVALDDQHMMAVAQQLHYFQPEVDVHLFPAWDCIPYDRVSPGGHIISERLHSLAALLSPHSTQRRVVITTVNAWIQKLPPRSMLEQGTLICRPGDTISRDSLSEFLIRNGYNCVGTATEPGEYALRGSIVDIVPAGESQGLRLDFFGDTLEQLRYFDTLSQISGGKAESLNLIPASEVLLTEETIACFRRNYRGLFGAVLNEDPLYEAVSVGRKYAGMEHWLPLFYEQLQSLNDYLPQDAVVLCDHLAEEAFEERQALIKDSYATRKDGVKYSAATTTYHPIPPEQLYYMESFSERLEQHSAVMLHPFAAEGDVVDAGYASVPNFAADSARQQHHAFELLKPFLAEQAIENKRMVMIACMSEGSRERMSRMLENAEIGYINIESWEERKKLRRKAGRVGVMILPLESGFVASDVTVISEQDILGERLMQKRRRKRSSENFLAEASQLSPGEYVVHKDHGIGRFEGLETLTVAGQSHDFLLLIYHGDDKLYVPVENIDLVTRYGVDSDGEVRLDKLGGVSWQQRTAALKKRIKDIAGQLLRVAARRILRKAPIFPVDKAGYEAFCARFPYTETEDQLRAAEEVEEDLQAGKPMDRLICGDVGFGKTEIALRAAYLVAHPEQIKHKGQVAVIVPTTLLCRQHAIGFQQRFANTGVTVRQLSRFVSPKEEKDTKQGIADGSVDIVIGTHALLSDSVEFKNLALVIVDEEQRFGVEQKEKLKRFRSNVHVLTMTATPIPRTLQLSLAGIRELSLITTPPVDRLAVRTYVMPFDPVVIREAILREHYRGGRSFYVCPRIKDLEDVETQLKELVPEVKVAVAHGQMPADHLDELMQAFDEGVYDVLLATTIVEAGLDIAAANTLIIHRADMYGLAQLYQLRGRVGRSKLRAYAYLTLPPKRMPTKQAVKRLEVMQKLDTLGAGFSLASHDMDIRGFGNLLGDEQSGNIKEVGVELYQSMLNEAIEASKVEDGENHSGAETISTQINIGASVLIPEAYVPDLELRMGLYRRIASLATAEEVEDMRVELVDRFGTLPPEVENLLSVVKIKQMCRKLGISKLDVGAKGATVSFHNDRFSNPDALIDFAMKNPDSLRLRGDQKLVLSGGNWKEMQDRMYNVTQSLEMIASLAA